MCAFALLAPPSQLVYVRETLLTEDYNGCITRLMRFPPMEAPFVLFTRAMELRELPAVIEELDDAGAGAGAATPQSTETKSTAMRARIIAFYRKHNPAKLTDVDKILANYAGKERELVERLHRRYNLPPPNFDAEWAEDHSGSGGGSAHGSSARGVAVAGAGHTVALARGIVGSAGAAVQKLGSGIGRLAKTVSASGHPAAAAAGAAAEAHRATSPADRESVAEARAEAAAAREVASEAVERGERLALRLDAVARLLEATVDPGHGDAAVEAGAGAAETGAAASKALRYCLQDVRQVRDVLLSQTREDECLWFAADML